MHIIPMNKATTTITQLALALVLGSTLFFLSSCKKDEKTAMSAAEKEIIAQTEENNETKAETDQSNTDAFDAVDEVKALSGGRIGDDGSRLCGCTIDSTRRQEKILTLVYDGVTPCFSPSRYRSGKIEVQLLNQDAWYKRGAILKLTMLDYKVRRATDNAFITFNGIKYLKNAKGYSLGILTGADSLVIAERAKDIIIKTSAGTQDLHSIARRTSLKVALSPTLRTVYRTNGDTTIEGNANTDSWGTNRRGQAYVNVFNSPLVSNTNCGTSRPVAGKITHKAGGNQIVLTLGLNEQGAPDTRNCAFGYRWEWMLATGQSGSSLKSY